VDALVDVAADMGGMEFGSGTHRRPALAELAISDESEAFFERMAASGEFRRDQAGADGRRRRDLSRRMDTATARCRTPRTRCAR
jgi:hypothetical protein